MEVVFMMKMIKNCFIVLALFIMFKGALDPAHGKGNDYKRETLIAAFIWFFGSFILCLLVALS